MKIYTTYFANLKKLPKEIVPISICGKCPNGFNGIQYKKLAPKYGFFMEWKQNHKNNFYIERFNIEVLYCLSQEDVVDDLIRISGVNGVTKKDIALVCYEKPNDFCHRHLVAKWLNEKGYDVKEYGEDR